MSFININCRDATALVLQGEDRRLGVGDQARLRLHLFICKACPRFVRQVGLMRRAMGPWRAYRADADDGPASTPE